MQDKVSWGISMFFSFVFVPGVVGAPHLEDEVGLPVLGGRGAGDRQGGVGQVGHLAR